jgi:hypothetical protein
VDILYRHYIVVQDCWEWWEEDREWLDIYVIYQLVRVCLAELTQSPVWITQLAILIINSIW